jgi:hypothetical protein
LATTIVPSVVTAVTQKNPRFPSAPLPGAFSAAATRVANRSGSGPPRRAASAVAASAMASRSARAAETGMTGGGTRSSAASGWSVECTCAAAVGRAVARAAAAGRVVGGAVEAFCPPGAAGRAPDLAPEPAEEPPDPPAIGAAGMPAGAAGATDADDSSVRDPADGGASVADAGATPLPPAPA